MEKKTNSGRRIRTNKRCWKRRAINVERSRYIIVREALSAEMRWCDAYRRRCRLCSDRRGIVSHGARPRPASP
jgi:hypothetical protein